MNSELLEEILSCPSLPSLPAVAVRVIELTSDPDVSILELAETIQNDQALAAKILRTVNSSFYGMREKVSSIHKSLILLGLSPVKCLALGFSLVQCISEGSDDSFDIVPYWRRGLYTAVAAKAISRAAGVNHEDEAFLGGLLQDIGMMALHHALGSGYIEIMRQTEGDHRKLTRVELSELDVTHSTIGAMLTERWKLPDQLSLPVKYHERPTAAPPEHAHIIRAVALGNIAHDVLTDKSPTLALRRFHDKAASWFKVRPHQCNELIREIAEASQEMAGLFKLDIGEYTDAQEVLKTASQQLLDLSIKQGPELYHGEHLNELLLNSSEIDPLTGIYARECFDVAAREAFEIAQNTNDVLSVVQVSIDNFDQIVASQGVLTGDDIFIGAVAILKNHFDPFGGLVCRNNDTQFAVILPGVNRISATKAAEEFRKDLATASAHWIIGDARLKVAITASVGTASLEKKGLFKKPSQLVGAAWRAVEVSQNAGGNCVRSFVPRAA